MLAPPTNELRLLAERALERLEFACEPQSVGLRAAMRDGLRAAGDARLRPRLALATAVTLGRPPASVLPLAMALELTYAGARMHDRLRAGELGREQREDVVLLAADALLAEAMVLVLRDQDGDPQRVLAAAAQLARATGVDGLVGTQYASATGTAEPSSDALLGAAVDVVVTLNGARPRAIADGLRRVASELDRDRPGRLRAALQSVPADTTSLRHVLGAPDAS